MKTEKKIHTSIKVPISLYDKLKRMADRENRSLHGFLILALKKIAGK